MAEASHTVAPWIAREGTSTGMEVVAKKPRGGDYVVARCGGKDREANAHLIAAAPDLLEASSAILDYATLPEILANKARHEDTVFAIRIGDLRRLNAAIAKAEGRTDA